MKKVTGIFALLMTLCALQMLTACGPRTGGTGATGSTGSTGAVGAVGPQGNQGVAGNDGKDASGVTIVKLCDGTTVYPTTFVEIGFCVDGNIYATYSANGGFSTMLPPGNYSSNAIGSSCNFTVGLNCKITH